MPSRAEIEKQIAELQAQIQDADDDDEVWIQEDGAPAVRLRGSKASAVLNRYKSLWADQPDESGAPPEDGDGAPDGGEGPSPGDRLFRRPGKAR